MLYRTHNPGEPPIYYVGSAKVTEGQLVVGVMQGIVTGAIVLHSWLPLLLFVLVAVYLVWAIVQAGKS